jgi:hypothetical protein
MSDMLGAMRGALAAMIVTTVLQVNSCRRSYRTGTPEGAAFLTLDGCFLPFFVTQLYFINKRKTLFKYSDVTAVGHHNEGMDGES